MITSYDIEVEKTFVPFYRVYTPYTLQSKATFYESYGITHTSLTFSSSSADLYGRMFQIQLVPKGVFHADNVDVTVKITAGLDNTVRTTYDSDPKFVLSDGYDESHYGIGFEVRDEGSQHCRGIQGIVGATLDSRRTYSGSSSSSSVLPEQFTMIINPSERWGACYYGSDSGVVSLASYSVSYLSLTNGLYLDVYREGTTEFYEFNYIIVEIHQN